MLDGLHFDHENASIEKYVFPVSGYLFAKMRASQHKI